MSIGKSKMNFNATELHKIFESIVEKT